MMSVRDVQEALGVPLLGAIPEEMIKVLYQPIVVNLLY
jgi:septum formation inhibitor-activating ATPase MinD